MKLFLAIVLWTSWALRFAFGGVANDAVKWNKCSGDFKSISGSSFDESERRETELQSQRQENFNFNGQPLKMTYVEDIGFFHFSDNNTRATGVYGDIYAVLSQFLNFTLVLSNGGNRAAEGATMQNGSFFGVLEDARLNQTDIIPKVMVYPTRLRAVSFTTAFWMNGQRMYAHENWKRNYTWMFNIFPTKMWSFIGILALMLSTANWVIERVLIHYRGLQQQRQLRSRSYADHIFEMSSVLCGQVDAITTIARRSKILAFTISCFCWIILTCYNAHLFYFMSKESTGAPFNDLKEFYENTNLHVAILHGSFIHACFNSVHSNPVFKRLQKAKRFIVLPNVKELFGQVCSNPDKYVLFDAEDAMAARRIKPCNLIPVGEMFHELPVASGISKRVKNRKIFDIGVLKLLEIGIIDAIKKRYLSPPKREVGPRLTDSLAIGIDGVLAIFGVLCLGVMASIVICVAENVLFNVKNRKAVQLLAAGLSTVKGSLYSRNADNRKQS